MSARKVKTLLCQACTAKPARHDVCDGLARRLDPNGRWTVHDCQCWCRHQGELW